MNEQQQAAMRQALEALDVSKHLWNTYHSLDAGKIDQAITALNQELEQQPANSTTSMSSTSGAADEPVAWCTRKELENMAKGFSQDVPARAMRIPQSYSEGIVVNLYTRPQPAAPAIQTGYAGVTIFIGDHKVTQHVTEVAIKHEREVGNAITQAAQNCLAMIAAAPKKGGA